MKSLPTKKEVAKYLRDKGPRVSEVVQDILEAYIHDILVIPATPHEIDTIVTAWTPIIYPDDVDKVVRALDNMGRIAAPASQMMSEVDIQNIIDSALSAMDDVDPTWAMKINRRETLKYMLINKIPKWRGLSMNKVEDFLHNYLPNGESFNARFVSQLAQAICAAYERGELTEEGKGK